MGKIAKRVKRRLPLVFIFLILVAGIGAILYPKISNWLSVYTSKVEICSYDSAVKSLSEVDIKEFELEAQKYNEAVASRSEEKISKFDYDEILSFTKALGYIDIPKIEVYLPIYHGVDEDTLQDGIGHIDGTSFPIGGKSTHAVLSGHTGLPSAEFFTNIDQLVEGDIFYIHILNKVLAYQVDQIKVVLPTDDSDTYVIDGEDYVTLLTCTPYGINDHRLLVRGKNIPYYYDEDGNTVPSYVNPSDLVEEDILPVEVIATYFIVIVSTVLIIIILLILFLPVGKKKKKNSEV